ncbi:MAG TPA: hypothetical protein PL033_18945 [Candidatus Brocadiia bacterium]|nr:hypothetical protein [Candidatus Brocadiia bacterium]
MRRVVARLLPALAIFALAGVTAPAGEGAPPLWKAVPAQKVIIIEAENLEGSWREQTNIPGFSGRGFRTSNADGVAKTPLSGEVDIPETGVYAVWVRAWEGGGDRRLRARLGGQALGTTHDGRFPGRFSWQRAGQAELPAGRARLEIWDAGNGYETADAVMMTKDLVYHPELELLKLSVMTGEEIEKQEADYVAWMSAPRFFKTWNVESWRARREVVREHVLDSLGLYPLPASLPLDVNYGGSIERDGYVLTRVYWQVWEGVYGSGYLARAANLPKDAKVPGVLCPHGHWSNGLKEDTVQRRIINLALKGYVVLGTDNVHVYNYAAGVQPLGAMTWSNMRALDLLCGLPEVDASRIGCAGCSGGGQQTFFLVSVDDRVTSAVVVGMSQQLRAIMHHKNVHCTCNHVAGLMSETDMPEMIACAAPRPVRHIIMQDWTSAFDKQGFPDCVSVYRLFGAEDKTDFRFHDTGHDYNAPKREQTYEWFNRHLMGKENAEANREIELDPPSVKELESLDHGDVRTLNASGPETTAMIATELLKRRGAAIPAADNADALIHYIAGVPERLTAVLRIPQPDAKPSVQLRETGEFRGRAMLKLTIEVEPGVRIPAILLRELGAPAGGRAFIFAPPEGLASLASKEVFDCVTPLIDAGNAVLVVNLRTLGEFAPVAQAQDINGLIYGRAALSMMTSDLLAAVAALRTWDKTRAGQVGLIGWRDTAVAALTAGALDRGIEPIAAIDIGATYRQADRKPRAPHVLMVGDVQQFAAAITHRRLIVSGLQPKECDDWLNTASRTLNSRIPNGSQVHVLGGVPAGEVIARATGK